MVTGFPPGRTLRCHCTTWPLLPHRPCRQCRGDCSLRVDRGGAFYSNQRTNRPGERAFFPHALNSVNVGFRIARAL
jgi:formylglycine-generating enzyme required for sulfatase activity